MKRKTLLLAIAMIACAWGSLYAQNGTDVTNLVGTSIGAWNGQRNYSSSVEYYYENFPCAEHPLYQQITGLDAGVYMATMKATSNLAWIASDLVDGDASFAYVYATNGTDTDKSYYPAHRSTGVSTYYERSVVVEILKDQTLEIGLGLDNLSLANWHTIQIVSLIKYDSYDELVGPLKAPLQAKLDEANSYITNSDDNPDGTAKAAFQAAIDVAQNLYDSKTTYSEVVEAAADFEQAIADLEAAYEVYALSGAIPHPGYPFDITFKIINPTFGNNNADGWTCNPAPGFQTYGNAEYYQKNFDINQTITGMPQAKYLLKVKAFQRPGDAADVIPAYVGAEDQADGTFGVTAEIYVNNASQKIKNAASAMRTSALGKGGDESNVNGYYIPNDMNSADKYFISDYYENEAEMICTTGTLKFGFRCSDGTGSKYWTIFDDFRLYMTEAIDLSVYQEELDLAVSKATEQANRNVPGEVIDAINAVITEYNKEWNTIDEYVAAIDAVNKSYENFDMDALETEYTAYWEKLDIIQGYVNNVPSTFNSQIEDFANYDPETIDGLHAATDAYEDLNATLAAVKVAFVAANEYSFESKYYDDVYALSQVDYEEITEGAHDDLDEAISNYTTSYPDFDVYDAMTSADDINNYVAQINSDNLAADEALRAAGVTYAENANPTEGNKFNLTFMLTNPNLEGLPTWAPCGGWFTDRGRDVDNTANSQVMTNPDATSEDGTKTAFYEYWSQAPAADNTFTLYQKLTLSAGIYNFSCYAFAQQPIDGEVRGVKFYANDTEGSTIATDRLAPASIEFVNPEDGEVKVGLKACTGNTYRWMGIGYVELYKLSNVKTGELSDADTEALATGAYTSITYNRALLTGLNTLVLPFSTTKEELGASMVLKFDGTEPVDGKVMLLFSEVAELSPNTPYAVYNNTNADIPFPTFENKTVVEPTDLTVAGTDYSFVGTYTKWTKNVDSPIVNGDYIAGAEQFKKAAGGNGLGAYRAYLRKESTSNADVYVCINGDFVDGIVATELLQHFGVDSIYNLNGQKVNRTQKGVYIVNGRKVVVK